MGEVVHDEPIQDDVERAAAEVEPPRIADLGLIGAPVRDHSGDTVGIGVDGHEPEGRRGKQVTSRVPAATHRKHIAAWDSQTSRKDLLLAQHLVAILEVERRLLGQHVEQVVAVVRRRAL